MFYLFKQILNTFSKLHYNQEELLLLFIDFFYQWFLYKRNLINTLHNNPLSSYLIPIFSQHNFSFDEFNPNNSITPSFLSFFLENFLTLQKTETGWTKRKATGSFYTPPFIAEYITEECLSHYLNLTTNITQEKLENLITNKEVNLTEEEKYNITYSLTQAKILDPAVGTGIFPLTYLHKTFTILSSFNQLNIDNIFRIIDNIYGVDIQNIALKIAKVRLSLYLLNYNLSLTPAYFDNNYINTDFLKPNPVDNLSFDIIFGNPPYIQLQKPCNREGLKYADLYKDDNYETFTRTGDIYCLFYEKGIKLLKDNGFLCFITSNKWLKSQYGEKLRSFFLKYNPLLLIDLKSLVYKNVDTCIFLIQKANNQNKLKGVDVYELKRNS